ncbi:MAG: hypothetical protein EBT38_04715 [Acidimicrobiia bacterium]|nr:hypothetical protein [Acidimicrobiia bacterium]
MTLSALLSRRLVFVTGKGGVGKSAVSAAIARLAAANGKRVLACEMRCKRKTRPGVRDGQQGFAGGLPRPGELGVRTG